MSLALASLGLLLVAALLGLWQPKQPLSSLLAFGASLILLGELGHLSAPPQEESLWSLGPLTLGLYLDALSRLFLGLCGLSFPIYLYSLTEPQRRGERGLLPLLLAGSILTLLAGTAGTFLLGWESLALTSYALSGLRTRAASRMASFLEVGGIALLIGWALLPSSSLADLLSHPPHHPALFLLFLVGFGAKLGLLPLGVWYPELYRKTRASGGALYSGALWMVAVYGLLRFEAIFTPTLATGWILLLWGLLSAVYGALRGLAEPDLKRLLAFSTLEQGGSLVLVLGASQLFRLGGHPQLANFGLLLAVYLALHQSLAKALAFQAAGLVESATQATSLDRLGGFGRWPWTTLGASVGLLSLGGLPPLAGFVSEWLIFQLLFQGYKLPALAERLLLALAGALFALLSAALLVATTKALGVGFLGQPRTPRPPLPPEPGIGRLSLFLSSALVLALGLLTFWIFPELGQGFHLEHLAQQIAPANLQIHPVHASFSTMSSTVLAIFLVIATLVIHRFSKHQPRRAVPFWNGANSQREGLQVSGTGYTTSLQRTFALFYRPRWHLKEGRYRVELRDWFEERLYPSLDRHLRSLSRWASRLQIGYVTLYTLYIFLAFLIALFVTPLIGGHP
jgi:hydrogenase-4 component B